MSKYDQIMIEESEYKSRVEYSALLIQITTKLYYKIDSYLSYLVFEWNISNNQNKRTTWSSHLMVCVWMFKWNCNEKKRNTNI